MSSAIVKAKPGKKKMGRPRHTLTEADKPKIEAMCERQCTLDEMCSVFSIGASNLNRELKELYKDDPTVRKPITFKSVYVAKRGKGLFALRSHMFDLAYGNSARGIEPHPAVAIFLAKNWLGMSDNPTAQVADTQSEDFVKAFRASVKEADNPAVQNADFEVIPNGPVVEDAKATTVTADTDTGREDGNG